MDMWYRAHYTVIIIKTNQVRFFLVNQVSPRIVGNIFDSYAISNFWQALMTTLSFIPWYLISFGQTSTAICWSPSKQFVGRHQDLNTHVSRFLFVIRPGLKSSSILFIPPFTMSLLSLPRWLNPQINKV